MRTPYGAQSAQASERMLQVTLIVASIPLSFRETKLVKPSLVLSLISDRISSILLNFAIG